ncbi:MAG: myo-inositol-1-phosphate synthase, partial [Nitrospiraceae bacterium]|nr:myo-inositol-1-phosphate synthase [Nitrospiraceae bacterium]
MTKSSIGIWLVGAKGGVATTAIMGLCALKRGLIGNSGLVSELPQFQNVGLADWSDFVVGGHEIRNVPLSREAMRMATENRAIEPRLVDDALDELAEIDRRIHPGTIHKSGPTIAKLASDDVPRRESPRQAVKRLQRDMSRFAKTNDLDHVVVVNVASTEP